MTNNNLITLLKVDASRVPHLSFMEPLNGYAVECYQRHPVMKLSWKTANIQQPMIAGAQVLGMTFIFKSVNFFVGLIRFLSVRS